MNVTLYINNSDERYIDKNITSLGSYSSFYLKDDTNLTHPTLKLSDTSLSENANYLYIQELGRYYYIRDKRYSKQCIYLDCEVDVLMSFKTQIRDMNAIISRNTTLYNLYLNDDKMEIYNYPFFQTLNMTCIEGVPFSMARNEIALGLVGAV